MKTILAKQQKSAQIFEFPKNNVLNNSAETVAKDSIKVQESLRESTDGLTKTDAELIKANKELSKNMKGLADTIKKQAIISSEKAKSITETATGRRQYRTIGDRIGDFKDKAKDFLTPRGFLDKTGIVKRGTGGFLSDTLDRGEEKKKYIKARMETKGTTFGDEKTFGRQFDEQQKIQRKMVKNESVIKGYEDLGFKDTQIKRSDAFKTRTGLAEDLIKVDTRVRPTKDEAPVAKTRSQGLLDAANTSEADTEAVSREETQLELLTKIEENTRPGGIKKLKEPAEKGFLASLLDFFTNKFGSILASALSMGKTLATGALGIGKSVLGKLGGSGMAGKVLGRTAAVAGGLYEGYTAWNEADEKVKSGEITQRQGTVEKGGAVGKGLGTTGGALAGGKLGAMIGTAILPGVGTAVGGIIGGIVGGLAGGKFGQEIGKMATDGALKLKDGFDEYVKKPFMEFFDGISKMFNESIVKPLTEFFQPITDFFKNMSTSISDAFSNFSIPEMSVEILGKKFSIGPFYPFKKEVKASKPIAPGNSDAGAGAGSSEFAKTDPRRLDAGKPTSELDAKFDKGMAKAQGKVDQQTGTKIAGQAVGDKLSPDQVTVMGQAIAGGKTYSPELMKKYDAQKSVKTDTLLGKRGASAGEASGDMKKGTWSTMSSKPTIENADGTKRLMTPQEVASAKEGMLNKTSMAAPTEASAVYNKSAENVGAAIVPAAAPSNTVIAPTTNVSNNTTQIVRLPSRNQDVSLQKYMNSRYGM